MLQLNVNNFTCLQKTCHDFLFPLFKNSKMDETSLLIKD